MPVLADLSMSATLRQVQRQATAPLAHAQPPQVLPKPQSLPGPALWRQRLLPRHRATLTPLLAAGLVGALLFAGLSDFGRTARLATPLAQQFDMLLQSAGLGLNEVALTGHRLTLDNDIYAALHLDRDGSLVGYDVAAARRRIEALSWVADAHIARVFPDKLKVHITERRAVAIWQQSDRSALIDATGRVLAYVANSRTAVGLPVLAGDRAPEAAAELLAGFKSHPEITRRIEMATRVGARRWSLAMSGGTVIHLPAASGRDGLGLLAELHGRTRLLDEPAQVIDLRKAGLVVVGPRIRTATAPRSPSRNSRAAVE